MRPWKSHRGEVVRAGAKGRLGGPFRSRRLVGGLAAACCLALFLGASATGCKIPTRSRVETDQAPEAADVVVLTIQGEIRESGEGGPLFGGDATSLRKILRRLRQVRTSKEIKTLVLRIGSLQAGWAQLAELRGAVARVREAGKRVVAHLDQAADAEYYLATAADEISMAEGGTLWMKGVSAQVIFIKELLAKVGVEAQFLHIGRYKGAAEPLTRREMSPEMEEALGAVLDTLYQELVSSVAKARGVKPDAVRSLVDRSPHPAGDLPKHKLVDRLALHREDTRSLAKGGSINWRYGRKEKKEGTLRNLMELLRPSELTRPPKSPHLALVYAEGPIIQGPRRKGLGVSSHVSSYHLVRVLDELRENERVRAVVLRIDSPGGSALASELIWQAVARLAKKKPVVASMGNVAASGGYYIASPATRILAQPTTLTGSIGVVGGKFSLSGLFDKIGISSRTITRGARADLFNLARPWTEKERGVIQRHMRQVYDLFLDRVAQGRKLPRDQVALAAEGRIWSGKAAAARKLVDRLGGLLDSVAEAKRLGKLPEDAKTAIYPRPKTWIQRLQEELGGSDARARVSAHLISARLGVGSETERLLTLATACQSWRDEPVLAWLPLLVSLR